MYTLHNGYGRFSYIFLVKEPRVLDDENSIKRAKLSGAHDSVAQRKPTKPSHALLLRINYIFSPIIFCIFNFLNFCLFFRPIY